MNAFKTFCFFLIVLICFSSCTNDGQKTIVKKSGTVPLIDGKIDNVWNNYSWLDIKSPRWARPNKVRPEDISGAYKILWDTANCYLLFKVTDDVKFAAATTYGSELERKFDMKLREYDGIELFFDPHNKKLSTVDVNHFNFKKFTYNSDSICTSTSTPVNSVVKGITFAQSDTNDGYLFEIKLPWKVLDVRPKSNMEIGFEVNIIDNDNYKPLPDILPKKEAILSWYNHSSESPYNRTDIYGTLVLKEM